MIVCHCAVVSDADVVTAIGCGSTTVRSLCAQTGAGRECGGCVGSLRALLGGAGGTCETAAHDVHRSEARHAARQPADRSAAQ